MSNRLIDECFSMEALEESQHNRFVSINIGRCLVIFDPYMINANDLINANMSIGGTVLVRARRPAWGMGNLEKYFHVIKY